jgi:hypothetical protein
MAYEVHRCLNEKYEIRSSSGRISLIVQRAQGSWTIDQDDYQRVFPSFDDALDCARELAVDPDLPPLGQM